MESNICLETLCGEIYPFVRSFIDRNSKSLSRFDESSKKDEQNKRFLIDENLPKNKTSGKLWIPRQPKCLSLIHMLLLVAHFLCYRKNTTKFSRSSLLK